MKAFIAVALLVASVAAGPLSIEQLLRQERSLLNGRTYGRIGGLRDLPLSGGLRDQEVERVTLPLLERLAGQQQYQQYQPQEYNGQVLSFEELYNTELFREYLSIPLFRQFLVQYPVVFQRYITSPLFQQFYTYPEFQQYFRNPVLFYKYIYPQIQVVAQEYRQVDSVVDTVRPIDSVLDTIRPVDSLYNTIRPAVDTVRPVGQYNNILDTVRSYFGGRVATNNVVDDVIRRQYQGQNIVNRLFNTVERRGIYGQQQTLTNVEIRYILEKIYRDLLLNKQTPVTEVVTDVKVLPRERVAVQERIVKPIVSQLVRDEVVRGQVVPEVVRDIVNQVERVGQQLPQNIYNRPVNTYENLINHAVNQEIQY